MRRGNAPTNDTPRRHDRRAGSPLAGARSAGVALSLIGLVVLAFALPPQGLLGAAQASSQDTVTRALPDQVMCGETVQVSLTVAPPAGTEAWLVDEVPAAQLDASNIDASDNGELVGDHVKWVSTSGEAAVLTYDVTVPADTPDGSELVFDGTYRFHDSMDSRATIAGDTTLPVICGSVERTLPATAPCGSSVEVTLTVEGPEGTEAWLIDETPPAGLNVSDVDPAHNGELVGTHVKWVSTDGADAVVTYRVQTPDVTADGGVLVFDGTHRLFPAMDERGAVTGDTKLAISCPGSSAGAVHAFDTDADCVFGEDELFSLVDLWKGTSAADAPTDDQLFQGIRHWKQLPGPYCTIGG